MSIALGRRWRISRALYLPAAMATIYNAVDVLSTPAVGLVAHHISLDLVAAFVLGPLMILRLRYPMATLCIAVAGDWIFQAPGSLVCALLTAAQYGSMRFTYLAGAVSAAAPAVTPWILGRPYQPVLDTANVIARALAYVVAPIVTGAYLRMRQVRIVSLTEYTEHLRHEQALVTERAQVEERNRIAREMHDVVAHRVTHVVVHAGALKLGADRGPEWVAQQADLIRRAGATALEELRAVLGVLRPPGEDNEPAPLKPPAVRAIERLVEGTEATGTPVELVFEKETALVPAEVRRTVYRIVQETLTNAVKYAPRAPVRVELRCTEGLYQARVTNEPPSEPVRGIPSGGNGLVGLRQRVEHLGGTFRAAPTAEGGFVVTATIPFGDPGDTVPPPQERDQ